MRPKLFLNGWACEGLFIVLAQEVITEHVQSCAVAEMLFPAKYGSNA